MRNRIYILIIIIAIALTAALWSRGHKEQTTQASAAQPPTNSATSSAPLSNVAVPADATATSSGSPPASGQPTSAQRSAASSSGSAPANGDLIDLLEKHSGNRDWNIELNDDGKPVRIAGHGLRVMQAGAETDAFLSDFMKAMGTDRAMTFTRKQLSSPRFLMIDYFQSVKSPEGDEIPVFGGWIRFKGSADGTASLIVNSLKPVDSSLRLDRSLSDEDAIQIARTALTKAPADAVFKVEKSAVVFVDSGKQELATEISITGPPPHWQVIVGQQSRSVIFQTVSTRY